MGHIELARWADLVLIAPATAHLIAKLASGAADDLLSTLCLATASPIAVAPAMNHQMWRHAATVRNVARISADGVYVLGPASGDQACGEVGPGRMLEPAELASHVARLLTPGPLADVGVLITAGPTREPIDPVRYISNHSSGKQGYALAQAFRDAGADVTLVTGPVSISPPPGVTTVRVTTAREMHDAVLSRVPDHAIFVGVAAVADYRPDSAATQKIKKSRDGAARVLELTENPDIIAAVARHPARPFVVGFAAETERAIDHAREKLVRKGLDLIVVNDVADKRIGFESDLNAVTLISRTADEHFAMADKLTIARTLVARVAAAYLAARTAG
jgi:phosphopantothenoylcysteine decarboxylase/phosphopantothenate--cysteine ligase